MLTISGIEVDKIFPDKNVLVDVVFEGFKLTKETKSVRLENQGEVAINITFKRTQDDPDGVFFQRQPKVFFNDQATFRIIPGEVIDVPFNFYPNQIGVFQEKLVLACSPEFSQQCTICINLVGQCKKKFSDDDALMKIESEIMRKAAEYEVHHTIKDLITMSLLKKIEIDSERQAAEDEVAKIINDLIELAVKPSELELLADLCDLSYDDLISGGEEVTKFSKVKNVFQFLIDEFENEMSKEAPRSDQEHFGKLLFSFAVDEMVAILEAES